MILATARTAKGASYASTFPCGGGVWGIALGAVSVAHACGGYTPDSISAIPGLGFYKPDLLLLFPILSGVIERPFYSLAGFRVATLGYSIQANLIASLVIGVCGFLGMSLAWRSDAILLIILAAPVAAMLIKLWWFSRVPSDPGPRRRAGWFIAATLVSTFVIATIPLWMHVFGTDRNDWAQRVSAGKPVAIIATLLAAIAIHITLFTRLKRNPRIDRRRGFEVLPAPSSDAIARALSP